MKFSDEKDAFLGLPITIPKKKPWMESKIPELEKELIHPFRLRLREPG